MAGAVGLSLRQRLEDGTRPRKLSIRENLIESSRARADAGAGPSRSLLVIFAQIGAPIASLKPTGRHRQRPHAMPASARRHNTPTERATEGALRSAIEASGYHRLGSKTRTVLNPSFD